MTSRLTQHLMALGLISSQQAEAAVKRQKTAGGGSLDTALLEQGSISEAELLAEVGEISGFRPVNLLDFEPNPEVAPLVPARIAEQFGIVPLSLDGTTLHIASCDPVPRAGLEELALLLGKSLEAWVAIEVRVRDWIRTVYKTELPPRFALLLQDLERRAPAAMPTFSGGQSAGGAAPGEGMTREMVEELALGVASEPIRAGANAGRDSAEEEEPIIDLIRRKEPREDAPRTPTIVPLAIEQEPRTPTLVPLSSPPPQHTRPVMQTHPSMQPYASPAVPEAASFTQLPPPIAPPRTEPQFLVFPNPGAVAFSSPSQTPPPVPRSDEPIVEWTLAQARAALRDGSRDRNTLLDVSLRYARRTFDFVAAFAVIRGAASGFSAKGEGAEASRINEATIPLDAASVFRTVAVTRGSYVGPLPPDALSLRYLETFGRAPRTVFLYPIEVKSRLVAILYGDSGNKPVSQRRLSELLLFCQELPGAFHELIQFRKQQAELKLPDVEGGEPTRSDKGSWSLGWSPFAAAPTTGPGRAASMPALVQVEASRPPPDFGAVLRRLTGPDAAMRSNAMAELARAPEASARALTQVFPGPTAWSRLPVNELPEADELGPIPGALSRLGRAGAEALAPLLEAEDGDTRYFALLTAGSLPYAELVGGILRGLFDYESDLSSAARVASTAFKRLPRFDGALRELRHELASSDSLRQSLAARALGVLHDRESIEALISLTASGDPMGAQAAADALRDITRASFGTNTRAWQNWWALHRELPRAEWLVLALRHEELEVRLSASEELIRIANDSFGYQADAAEPQREPAVLRWEATVRDPIRGRRFSVL